MGGYHPVTLFRKYKPTKEYQELIKQMQNVINIFTAPWTSPGHTSCLTTQYHFTGKDHSFWQSISIWVLFVSLLSVPQVCLHNQVSMEPCTGERGKAKQNKIQNWPREPGNCTLPWFVWEMIKNQKPMATL